MKEKSQSLTGLDTTRTCTGLLSKGFLHLYSYWQSCFKATLVKTLLHLLFCQVVALVPALESCLCHCCFCLVPLSSSDVKSAKNSRALLLPEPLYREARFLWVISKPSKEEFPSSIQNFPGNIHNTKKLQWCQKLKSSKPFYFTWILLIWHRCGVLNNIKLMSLKNLKTLLFSSISPVIVVVTRISWT